MRPSIPSLTGIRGVAALWVVLFHCNYVCPELSQRLSHFVTQPLAHGWGGVDLFFVLSGFILMGAHGLEFTRLEGAAVSRFAKLRALRVYPLNLVVLLLIVALMAADHGFASHTAADREGNLSVAAFVRTAVLGTVWLPGHGEWNGPVWSLSAEILGYAAFPSLAFGINTLRFGGALLLASCSLAALGLYQSAMGVVGYNDLHSSGILMRMACCFCAGAAACQAHMRAPARLAGWAGALSVATLLLVGLCVNSWRGCALMPLCWTLLIFALAFGRGPVDAVLRSRVALFFGRISFPLYLTHVVLLFCLLYHLQEHTITAGAGVPILLGYLGVCVALATALHHAVEVPCHRVGRAWARRAVTPLPSLAAGRVASLELS